MTRRRDHRLQRPHWFPPPHRKTQILTELAPETMKVMEKIKTQQMIQQRWQMTLKKKTGRSIQNYAHDPCHHYSSAVKRAKSCSA